MSKENRKCNYCGKKSEYIRWVKYINVGQKIVVRWFCNKECKNNWIYRVQKKELSNIKNHES